MLPIKLYYLLYSRYGRLHLEFIRNTLSWKKEIRKYCLLRFEWAKQFPNTMQPRMNDTLTLWKLHIHSRIKCTIHACNFFLTSCSSGTLTKKPVFLMHKNQIKWAATATLHQQLQFFLPFFNCCAKFGTRKTNVVSSDAIVR